MDKQRRWLRPSKQNSEVLSEAESCTSNSCVACEAATRLLSMRYDRVPHSTRHAQHGPPHQKTGCLLKSHARFDSHSRSPLPLNTRAACMAVTRYSLYCFLLAFLHHFPKVISDSRSIRLLLLSNSTRSFDYFKGNHRQIELLFASLKLDCILEMH